MSKTRKHYTPEEKAGILKRYLVEKVPLSELCDEDGPQSTSDGWRVTVRFSRVLRPSKMFTAVVLARTRRLIGLEA